MRSFHGFFERREKHEVFSILLSPKRVFLLCLNRGTPDGWKRNFFFPKRKKSMKLEKTLFILSVMGILLLIFLAQTTSKTQTGTIKSVQTSNNKITIHLENNPVELIIFNTAFVILKKGDIIEFQGKQDIYKGKEQIIVDKIFLLHYNNS